MNLSKKISAFCMFSILALAVQAQTNSRIIRDLGGNEVRLPEASSIKRIVSISPPLMSFIIKLIPDKTMIAGMNARTFTTSNPVIVEKLFPNWQQIPHSFVDQNFVVNKESLYNLQPDLVLYYGEVQKKGLDNSGLPSLDFFSKQSADPKDVSISWERQIRQIFNLNPTEGIALEWFKTEETIAGLTKKQPSTAKTALCIFSNINGKIMVYGSLAQGAHMQGFFDKAGIKNVADEIRGTAEVSMEKIYAWNPDLIFVFLDAPAKNILNNTTKGQDWSLLNAWKTKQVYDVPRTTYSWTTPCADSPLMPLWLISKAWPSLLSEEEFKHVLRSYYQNNYQIDLSEVELASILELR